MPRPIVEDAFIRELAATYPVSDLRDCSIAVDATYYLQQLVDTIPSHEPLLVALGGLTGIRAHIDTDLKAWESHGIVPFFMFDGQYVVGQTDVLLARGRQANVETNRAWDMYFSQKPKVAVDAFGDSTRAFRVHSLYHTLQSALKERGLHFIVAPYNAAAQMAHLDATDSDQIAGLMGPNELLLYPIHDTIIKSINWQKGEVSAVSRDGLIRELAVLETTFIDAMLMQGTYFLSPFPPLQDAEQVPGQPHTIRDAVNMLRTTDKSVASACTSYSDILNTRDPDWLDKYRKARMVVNHYIYIAESGAVCVENYDKLTGDNHEYLGLQLPAELFHYLNVGLVGPSALNWITFSQIVVLPTIDGYASDEYKRLITTQLVPVKETTLGLLIPRLHRGIQHSRIVMKVWFDTDITYPINHRNPNSSSTDKIKSWSVSPSLLTQHSLKNQDNTLAFEIQALENTSFASSTIKKKGDAEQIDSAEMVVSSAIWKFLQLREYANDRHGLTTWGQGLAKAMSALGPTVEAHPDVPYLNEALVVAFDLVRYDLLNNKRRHDDLKGLPLKGSEEEKDSLLLLSRCATLLKLRQQPLGFTGPLNKNLLAFRSLASAVREADRDLIEAVVASDFLHGHVKRERDDYWQIGDRLPFLASPDIAMGIAIKTLLDDVDLGETPAQRNQRIEDFSNYIPYATHFEDDINIFRDFFMALHAGIQAASKEMSPKDLAPWDSAKTYLEMRWHGPEEATPATSS